MVHDETQSEQHVHSLPECGQAKREYEDCFMAWYRDKFLQGVETDSVICSDLWIVYQQCLRRKMNQSDELRDLKKHIDSAAILESFRRKPGSPPPDAGKD